MAEVNVLTKEELLRLAAGSRNAGVTNSPSRIRQTRRRLEAFGALAAVLILGLLAGLIFSSHAYQKTPVSIQGTHAGTATTQATCDPNVLPPGVPGSHTTISSISMVSATAGWAVGTVTQYSKVNQSRSGIIMQLVNGRWVAFGQLYPGVVLKSISMDTASDGWALGVKEQAGGGVLALHYTGGAWVSVSLPKQIPNGDALMVKVEMVSPADGWMLAQFSIQRNPGDPASRGIISILRYRDGTWTPVPLPSLPDTVAFSDMSATDAGGAWFIGTDYAHVTAVWAGYDNGQWTVASVSDPGPGDESQVYAVSMASATDGWMIGTTAPNSKTLEAPVLLHFSGAIWTRASLPPGLFVNLTGVYAFPDGDVWLTGVQNVATQPGQYDYVPVLAELAGGDWHLVTMPYPTLYLTAIAEAAPGQFWAAGQTEYTQGCGPEASRSVVIGSVLHYAAGAWSKQDLP
jgi:hypothetical protein